LGRGHRRVRLHHFLRHWHRRIRWIRHRGTTAVALLAPLPVTNGVITGTDRIDFTIPDTTDVAVAANTSERFLSLASAIATVPVLADIVAPPEDNLCQQGNRNKTLSPGGAAGIAMACIVLHLAICAAGAIWLELAERSTQASPGGKLKAHCDNTLSKVESSCSHRVVCPTVQGVQVVPAAVQGVQVHEVQEQVHKRVEFFKPIG